MGIEKESIFAVKEEYSFKRKCERKRNIDVEFFEFIERYYDIGVGGFSHSDDIGYNFSVYMWQEHCPYTGRFVVPRLLRMDRRISKKTQLFTMENGNTIQKRVLLNIKLKDIYAN